MRLIILENAEQVSEWVARHVKERITSSKEEKNFVLGLPTGSSPIGTYKVSQSHCCVAHVFRFRDLFNIIRMENLVSRK